MAHLPQARSQTKNAEAVTDRNSKAASQGQNETQPVQCIDPQGQHAAQNATQDSALERNEISNPGGYT